MFASWLWYDYPPPAVSPVEALVDAVRLAAVASSTTADEIAGVGGTTQ